VLGAFGLAIAVIVGFLLVESRRSKPMLPLGLFRSGTFSATSTIGLVVNVAFYGLIFVFSLYFQTTQHYSALATGLAFAPTTAAVLVANLIAGRLTHRLGTQSILAGSALLMAASLAGLLVIGSTTPYPVIVIQLVALGFGLGLIVPAMTTALRTTGAITAVVGRLERHGLACREHDTGDRRRVIITLDKAAVDHTITPAYTAKGQATRHALDEFTDAELATALKFLDALNHAGRGDR